MVKFATNNWLGKPIRQDDGMYYNGHRVYIGYNWVHVEDTIENLFAALTQTGMPIGPICKDGHKTQQNFEYSEFVGVDIDDDWTIEQMYLNSFFQDYATIFYTTPSHTEEHHKFRVLFRLETPITNVQDMRHLYNALIQYFGSDRACKDGSRYFNGTINAAKSEMWANKFLPDRLVKSLIDDQRDQERKGMERQSAVEYQQADDEHKERILSLLEQCYCGEYPVWFKIACGLKHGGFSYSDFERVTLNGLMRSKNSSDCRKVWGGITGSHLTKATMGTVVWFIESKLDVKVFKNRKTKEERRNEYASKNYKRHN